jgi:hypothetical protein
MGKATSYKFMSFMASVKDHPDGADEIQSNAISIVAVYFL